MSQARPPLCFSLASSTIALAAGTVLLASSVPFTPARALVTALPTNAVAFDSDRTGNFEIFTMNTEGTDQIQLTHDPSYDSWWPKISPDRTKILFLRTPPGIHDRDYTKVSTWVMNVDGTRLAQILALGAYGWTIQGHAEWSPDGTKIVTMGGPSSNSQVYILNVDGTNPFNVTNGRGGMNIDPSWSPNGTNLLFIGCPIFICFVQNYEVYSVNADRSGLIRLTNDSTRDHDPYFSPDGSTITWLRNPGGGTVWSIFKMNPDGSGQAAVINDGAVNSKPEWAFNSTTIWFHRIPSGGSYFNIWKVSKSGTRLVEVILPRPAYNNEFPDRGTP